MPARNWTLTLAVAAFLAGPFAGRAVADDQKDELAEGDWHGKYDWKAQGVAGGATTPPPVLNPPDPGPVPSGGTPTEPTEPTGGPGTGPTPYGPSDPPAKPPCPPPGVSVPCSSIWSYVAVSPDPEMKDKITSLTMTLLRTDAYAFLCNLYARSESTWYIDWFATTAANETGNKQFEVEVKITGACPICSPQIAVDGTSNLESKAQIRTSYGGTHADSMATSAVSTMWAGPIDCSDDCSTTAKYQSGTSKWGAGFAGAKIENTETKGYVYAVALGGKAKAANVKAGSTKVTVTNLGTVAVYTAGEADNAQAKVRAGYWLHLKGVSACGSWGEYRVELQN